MNKRTYRDDIDASEIFLTLWYRKYFISVFVLVSLLCFFYTAATTEKTYTAETILSAKFQSDTGINSGVGLNVSQSGNLFALLGGNQRVDSFTVTVLGANFLKHLLDSTKLDEQLRANKLCMYSSPGILTFTGLFSSLGLVDELKPSKEQLTKYKIECLRRMLEIEKYKYKGQVSDAYRVKVSAKNQEFVSIFANFISSQYLFEERIRSEKNLLASTSFMSKEIAKTKLKIEEIRKKLEDFYSENSIIESQVVIRGNSLIDYKEIEKRIDDVKRSHLLLKEFLEKNTLITLNSLNLDSSNLSKEYAALVREFLSGKEKISGYFFNEKTESEKKRLLNLMASLEKIKNNLKNDENNQRRMLREENFLKRQLAEEEIYKSSLESTIRQMFLKQGISSTYENRIFSSATKPLYPSGPDLKLLLLAYITVAILLGSFFVLLTQYRNRKFYSFRNLTSYFDGNDMVPYEKFIDITGSDLKGRNHSERKFKAFLSTWLGKEKVCGLIIDLNHYGVLSRPTAIKLFISEISKLFVNQQSSVASVIGSRFRFSENFLQKKEFIEHKHSFDTKIENKGKLTVINDELNIKNRQSEEDLVQILEKFDKLIITKVASQDLNEIFSYMKKCDFYVLVGEKGRFSSENLEKCLPKNVEDDTKLAGIAFLR